MADLLPAEMRGLTVRQPWANAIAYGSKRIENRPRPLSWRGTLAIHAGKTPDVTARPPAGESWPQHRMHLGAIIAVADLVGCHRDEGSTLFGGCSEWAVPGQYHWELANVRPLAEPIPWKGALGLWRIPAELQQAINQLIKD